MPFIIKLQLMTRSFPLLDLGEVVPWPYFQELFEGPVKCPQRAKPIKFGNVFQGIYRYFRVIGHITKGIPGAQTVHIIAITPLLGVQIIGEVRTVRVRSR